jgi:hypothetical protein
MTEAGDQVAFRRRGETIGPCGRRRARSDAGQQPSGDGFEHPVADARPVKIIDGFEIVDIEQQHRGTAVRRVARFQRRSKPGKEPLTPGDPGQPIGGILDRLVGRRRHDLVQRGDDALDGAVATKPRAHADGAAMELPRGIAFAGVAAIDGFARQRAPLQLGKLQAAVEIEFVVALTGQRRRGEPKIVDPGSVGRDIAQLAIEHRDAGRDLVDEASDPLRRGRRRRGVAAGCHRQDECLCHPRNIGGSV